MKKFKDEEQREIENCLKSELVSFILELQLGNLSREDLIRNFSNILLAAKVDSDIIVNVLEQFGEDGKEQAMCIKVCEGW
jgi:hypothetical protein